MTTHGSHIVVGHDPRDGAQFLEGLFMKPDDLFQGFIGEVAKIEPAAEAQDNGTCMDDLGSSSEDDPVGAPVHLSLFARGMVDGRGRPPVEFWPNHADVFFKNGIASPISQFLDLFHDPHRGEFLFSDQIADFGLVGVEFALSFKGCGCRRNIFGFQCPANGIATETGFPGRLSDGALVLKDLVDQGSLFCCEFAHGCSWKMALWMTIRLDVIC